MGVETDKPTIIDRLLARTILPFVPDIVTPNHITAFRLAATPFVIYFLSVGDFRWGLLLFVIAAFSDALDGALARVRGPITDWGKMYDPLADKFLIGSVSAIAVSRLLGQWLALTIIGLELLIIMGAFWRRRYRQVEIKAMVVGKIKMILQSVGVGLLLLYVVVGGAPLLSAAYFVLVGSIFFSVLSLIAYQSI